MSIKLNPIQRDPVKATLIHQYLKQSEEESGANLVTAFKKMNEKAAEARKAAAKKKKSKKKMSSIVLSNTDTVNTCLKVKKQLNAKLSEIYSSTTMDEKVKQMLIKDVVMQINKVEVKITEIKRREAALIEERNELKDESQKAKRRRQQDIKRRSTTITRDYLYTASEGGLDPSDPLGVSAIASNAMAAAGAAAVTAEIGGGEISMSDADVAADISMAAVEAAASLEVTV